MQPSARLQAAVEILQALETTAQPADRLIRSFFRARRYAGSKDRAAVAGRVYAVLRQQALFSWRMDNRNERSLVLGSLLEDGLTPAEIDALFDGSPHGPPPLTEPERRALAQPRSDPPRWARLSYPEWLDGELSRAFGDALEAAMQAMQLRAAVDLRVNTLKTTREAVAAALAEMGFAAEPTPVSPWGLRLPPGEGSAKLGASKLFESGAFEFQDEAAQIAALLCGAKPGMRVLDLAAGAGGKSLALAAMVENQGEIVATDVAPQRLRQLEGRAARAGAKVACLAEPSGRFDMVLVDAPCSGTGTWRRQPEQRWRLKPARLAALTAIQDGLLDRAAGFVKPGGRLVYATCSVLPCENRDRVEAFLARHPEFTVFPASAALPGLPGGGDFFVAAPQESGTDGFFAAVLQVSE
jgi:16S rRNA (cytosine967-C5)-methyltransferase